MALIVGLSGWRRSGKDTVGNYLVENHGFKKISFAGALKDAASELFGIDRKLFDDDNLKDQALLNFPLEQKTDATSQIIVKSLAGEFSRYNNQEFFSPRTLCILLGSMGRVVDNAFWVKRALRDLSLHENYVITDLRFTNEVVTLHNTIKFHKIHTSRINRFSDITSSNPSERDLDNFIFDSQLNNTGSMSELFAQVDTLIKGLA